MRLLYIIIGLYVLTGMFAACSDDEGNYDYRALNTITVEGLNQEYSVDQNDTLRIDGIKPNFALQENSDLAYEWSVRKRVVSTDLNCRGYITESPGTYDSYLCITDRTNNLKYYYEFKLVVESAYSKGLYILSEMADGTARLSVQRRDREDAPVMNGVFELMNPDLGHLGSKPVQITYDDAWTHSVFVVCREGDRKLLQIDPKNLYLKQYWNETSIGEGYTGSFVPDYFCNYMGVGMILSKGELYMFNYGHNNTLYYPVEGYNFSWVGTNPTFSNEVYYAYDENSQTFKMLRSKINPLLFNEVTTLEEFNTAGQTYQAVGTISKSTYDRVVYPVLYDPATGTEHYYEIDIDVEYDDDWNSFYTYNYTEKMTRLAVMERGEVCLLSNASYWFVAKGNKVIRYFFSANSEVQDWITDLKGTVTSMLFDSTQDRILMASYDGTKSYVYEISAVNPNQQLKAPLEVEGKIVSMCAVGKWKY